MGLMLADTYFTILKQVPHLNWFFLQLIMVAPTFLLPVGFFLFAESPRWLIASRNLHAAERVMLSAAKLNGSRGDCMALLIERVEQRPHAEGGANVPTTGATEMTSVVRRRAVITFGSSFSVMMAYYSLLLSLPERRSTTPWVEWAPLGANALAYGLLLKLVNRIQRTRLITSAFIIVGILCSFASIAELTAAGDWTLNVVADIFLVLTLAACGLALVLNFVYVAELFPTPFRGVSACLVLPASRLGGMVGALFSALEGIGREDLLFALIATAVYSSAYSFQYLPLEYGTYAGLADAEVTVTCPSIHSKRSLSTIDEMKQSLASLPPKKTKRTKKSRGESAGKRLPKVAATP